MADDQAAPRAGRRSSSSRRPFGRRSAARGRSSAAASGRPSASSCSSRSSSARSAQVVSIPFSFLSTGLTTIIAPTGDPEPIAIIGVVVAVVLTQVVTLLIQSVAVVVQATATAIIYIDCRMRREGLDIDLLTYIERRDAGAVGPADPYRENIGRVIAPRPLAYPHRAIHPQAAIPQAPLSRRRAIRSHGYGPPPRHTRRSPESPTSRLPAAAGYRRSPAPCRPPGRPRRGSPRPPPAPTRDQPPRADPWTAPGAPSDRATPSRRGRSRRTPRARGDQRRRSPRTATRPADWAERSSPNPVYAPPSPRRSTASPGAIGEFVERLFSAELSGEWGPWVAVIAAVVVVGRDRRGFPRLGRARAPTSRVSRAADAVRRGRAAHRRRAAARCGILRR